MANLIDIGAAHQAFGNPTKLPSTQTIESKKQARTIADDFEAVFLGQMLKPMFQGIKPEAPFGGGNSEAMWRSMQIEEYGKAIGADAYCRDAAVAVETAKEFVARKHNQLSA